MGLEAPETNAPLSVNAEALGRQGTDTVSDLVSNLRNETHTSTD